MKGYTTQTKIENYLLTEIDESFEGQIESWIETAEAYIDNYTGRNFIADAEPSTRLFDGDNSKELPIDDAIAVTDILIDGESIVEEDEDPLNPVAWFYPTNSIRKNKIVLNEQTFLQGRQNIAIEANWGYSETVPADIQHAATVLVAGIIQGANKKVASETIGGYSVRYETEKGLSDFANVKEILNRYRKFSF